MGEVQTPVQRLVLGLVGPPSGRLWPASLAAAGVGLHTLGERFAG